MNGDEPTAPYRAVTAWKWAPSWRKTVLPPSKGTSPKGFLSCIASARRITSSSSRSRTGEGPTAPPSQHRRHVVRRVHGSPQKYSVLGTEYFYFTRPPGRLARLSNRWASARI